ncbi:MAG: Snf7 family protein [Candidatus Odinarchaeia archaeon]
MNFLRKLLPKRKLKRDEAITEMRAAINQFTLRSRYFYNKSLESKKAAKELLKQGNVEAAKLQLKRWNRYRLWYNRYQKQIGSLEDTIDMIQAAEDVVTMGKALELGSSQLEEARKIMSSEKALETMEKTRSLMDEIEITSDMLSEQIDLDETDDSIIEKEFEKLQNEIALEESVTLPKTPTSTEIEEFSKKEKLKKEVEELKKEVTE